MHEIKNEILTNEMQTKLSQVMSPQMKLDGTIKEHIATRRPVENCVRVYDEVIDSEWCNDVIDKIELICPTNHYSDVLFDETKPTLILYNNLDH